MKKFFLKMLPVFLVAAVSVGFASCGDDDEEKINPVGSESNDKGVDGLKGYWVSDDILENWNHLDFHDRYIYYLDGEGGGTAFHGISFYENEDDIKYYYVYNNFDGSEVKKLRPEESYRGFYLGRFAVNNNNFHVYNMEFYNHVSNSSSMSIPGLKNAFTYYLQGSTLQIYSGGTNLTMLNISNKQIVGFNRMEKIN